MVDTLAPTAPDPQNPQGTPMQVQQPAPATPDQSQTTPAPAQEGFMGKTLDVLKAPQHILGQTLGKVVSGLSGAHNEYSIDPSTGQTISTQVKDPPGQTFRSILALGLMGGQGIGPRSGQTTFTQGLLAGLGGGAKESQNRNDQLDQQRRAQAQQQYANQLKAEEANRQQKQLTLQEQMNRAQIANFNQEQAARQVVMDKQLYDLKKEQATDSSVPDLQMAQVRMTADTPKVEGYKELGIDPITTVPASQASQYLQDNPGHPSEYVGLQTGVKQTFDPKTGTMSTESVYSIYPKMTKVPPSLLAGLKAEGADKTGNPLAGLYSTLNRAQQSDSTVPIGSLLAGYRQLTDWNKIQKDALDVQVKQTQIAHDRAETWLEDMDAQLKKLGINDAEDQKTSRKLFTQYYDEGTHSLSPQASIDLNPDAVDKNGKPLYNDKQKQAIRDKVQLLKASLDSMYEAGMKDGFDRNKFAKDGNGNIISTDSTSAYTLDMIKAYGNASSQLENGFQTPSGNLSPRAQIIVQRIKAAGITDPSVIQQSLVSSGAPETDQQEVFKALGIPAPASAPTPAPASQVEPWGHHSTPTEDVQRAITNAPAPTPNTAAVNF